MSQSFDINSAYNALDDTVYDIFDVDAYCSSLSPPVSPPEPVPDSAPPTSHVKRYPKTCGHPCLSPAVVPAPSVTATPVISPTISAKPDKGKGRQYPATPAPPASPVDPLSPNATASIELTPEQHLCFVRMLKRLDEWFAQGWEPGVNKSRLQTLAEIFNAAESVAEGSICNI